MSKQPEPVTQGKRIKPGSKIRPVPIAAMRVPPVNIIQRAFSKAQANKYATELDLNKLGYPVINYREGIYWIVDGQHRIAALKQRGFGEEMLDCEVYEDLTDAEMAAIFIGRDDRRRVSPFSKFHISCTAEFERECNIRRIVESQGLKVSQSAEDNCIGAVGALYRVYDRAGDTVLGQALRSIRDGFSGDPAAFDSYLIQGLGLFFNRFNGQTDERHLVSQLAHTQYGVTGLLRRAEAQRQRTGHQKVQCVAAAVVDLYNKNIQTKKRLPNWWKSAEV
ncbi:MAG: hypothetical protein PHR30_16640 [Gallionellaceae bacterium]|nr:hypothetical protein [Gallionellaceae bacterium]